MWDVGWAMYNFPHHMVVWTGISLTKQLPKKQLWQWTKQHAYLHWHMGYINLEYRTPGKWRMGTGLSYLGTKFWKCFIAIILKILDPLHGPINLAIIQTIMWLLMINLGPLCGGFFKKLLEFLLSLQPIILALFSPTNAVVKSEESPTLMGSQ